MMMLSFPSLRKCIFSNKHPSGESPVDPEWDRLVGWLQGLTSSAGLPDASYVLLQPLWPSLEKPVVSSESSEEDGMTNGLVSKLRFFVFVWYCSSLKMAGVAGGCVQCSIKLCDQDILLHDCLNRLTVYSLIAFKSFCIVNQRVRGRKTTHKLNTVPSAVNYPTLELMWSHHVPCSLALG